MAWGAIIGIDPAEQMILEAARLNPKATFKVGFAESLPIADETADIVVSSLSFHHWENQKEGIREIARVLSSRWIILSGWSHYAAHQTIERENQESWRDSNVDGQSGSVGSAISRDGVAVCPYHISAKMWSECGYPDKT